MSATTLNDADIAALVKDFYATILEKDGNDRLMSDVPDNEQMRAARAEHYRILAERARIDLASNAFGSVRWITIDELTGHETPGETARYSKGLTVANLKTAIDRLDIGVDLTRLHLEK